jgi:quercetin dioxygenase-like cupin family protein
MTKNILIVFSFVLILTACKNKPLKETSSEKPIYITKSAGKQWNVFGVQITGKILSEDTNGAYSIIITETPPAGGPPKHVHTHEDELFYVLQGKYEFYCGNQTIVVNTGDMVRLPKGIPHHFKNIDSLTGITMNTITPGGFEGFFDDISKLSKTQKPTRQEIDSIAKNYGMSFVKK